MLREDSPINTPPGDPSGGVVYFRIVLCPEESSRMWVLLNIGFNREGLLAPRPTPKLEDHPSSAVRDCLFNLLAATLLIGGRSSIRNRRTRHAVMTGTHYIAVCHSTQPKCIIHFKCAGVVVLILISSIKQFRLNLFCNKSKVILLSVYIATCLSLSCPFFSSSDFFKTFKIVIFSAWVLEPPDRRCSLSDC